MIGSDFTSGWLFVGSHWTEETCAWLTLSGHYIIQTVCVEAAILRPADEEYLGELALLIPEIGWDTEVVDAVDALFTAYEYSHGML